MHKVWQKEILSISLVGLSALIFLSQKTQTSKLLITLIGILLMLVMTALWYVAGSKQFWSWRGYSFSHGNITAIERIKRHAGRTHFLLKPGTNEFVKMDIEIEFMTTENIAQISHTQIWVREFYRYLADIKNQQYQYRTPDYHVGDTVEVFFKDTDPTNIKIW